WNGWGVPLEEFAENSRALREAAGGRKVEATWAGVALVGEDEDDARALVEARRVNSPIEADLWNGSAEAFAEHLRALEAVGASWAIVQASGPSDRIDVIASGAI